jgi:ribosomal protein S18 acetylase RimI-like enzyme
MGMRNTPRIEYRPAAAEDVPLLADLNLHLIRDEGHRNRMTRPELEERLRKLLQGPYRAVLIEVEGVVAGYVLFRRDPDHLYLRHLYIRPEFRRRGLGRAAVAWLRERGESPRLRVDVLVRNEAGLAFWRALGFTDYCLTLELEAASATAGEALTDGPELAPRV